MNVDKRLKVRIETINNVKIPKGINIKINIKSNIAKTNEIII